LYLSVVFLQAIPMNHIAHSEANEAAKVTEATLKDKIDEHGDHELETVGRAKTTGKLQSLPMKNT
jgi:hypothetical protein